MRYREFGKSGITGSEVGFGVWTVSTKMWGVYDDQIGLNLLQQDRKSVV